MSEIRIYVQTKRFIRRRTMWEKGAIQFKGAFIATFWIHQRISFEKSLFWSICIKIIQLHSQTNSAEALKKCIWAWLKWKAIRERKKTLEVVKNHSMNEVIELWISVRTVESTLEVWKIFTKLIAVASCWRAFDASEDFNLLFFQHAVYRKLLQIYHYRCMKSSSIL